MRIRMVECDLCKGKEQEFRVIKKKKHAFCMVCRWPLKRGHVLVLPTRHVESLKELDNEEVKDFVDLVEEIKEVLNDGFEEDVIVFQNSGRHSSQNHVHYHLLPSKGRLRALISKFEGISEDGIEGDEELKKMRNEIWKSIKNKEGLNLDGKG